MPLPETNPRCFHVSASAISALKACPQRFRLAYREGLRLTADTDSQRMGTNWHSMHEVYALHQGLATHAGGEEVDGGLAAVVEYLNQRYAQMPTSKTAKEWALEREILLISFIGYLWYWQHDPVEVLASEVAFDLPLHAPRVGLPLPLKDVVRVGKFDHIVRWQGMVGCMERKSTSRSIAPDSDYWDKAKKDTQVSMYALAFRDLITSEGNDILSAAGIEFSMDDRPGNTLYDVWHKPTIKPAMLTQKETAEFIQMGTWLGLRQTHSGEYHGQTFNIDMSAGVEQTPVVRINGELPDVEIGKKGFAIRETVEMFGARLLTDIHTRPEFYYARKEIVRTDQEIRKFRFELFNIYEMQRLFDKTGHWYENESQCRATFPCSYIPICFGCGADAACDGKTVPAGFKRIFVNPVLDAGLVTEE